MSRTKQQNKLIMWKCKKCKEEVEDQFDVCWNCGCDKAGNVALVQEKPKPKPKMKNEISLASTHFANKIVNVTLSGGIIGLLSASPQNALNDAIETENEKGWKVVQIIPADSGNLFLTVFRFLLLICTLCLYTTANGYYLVMEKVRSDRKVDNRNPSANDVKCSECGKEYPSNLKDSFCEECGNQL